MAAVFDICRDAQWIADRMSQPDVVEISFPDGVAAPSEAQICSAINAGHLEFIRICVDGVPLGFFLLELKYPTMEIHTVISKEHRGAIAFRAAKEFPAWAFNQYQACSELITQVPKHNRAAALFAMRSGLSKCDAQGDVFCKNGNSEHMEIYAIKRGS